MEGINSTSGSYIESDVPYGVSDSADVTTVATDTELIKSLLERFLANMATLSVNAADVPCDKVVGLRIVIEEINVEGLDAATPVPLHGFDSVLSNNGVDANVNGGVAGTSEKVIQISPVASTSMFQSEPNVDANVKQANSTMPSCDGISKLHNEEAVEGATVAIPSAAIEEVRNKFGNTIYGDPLPNGKGYTLETIKIEYEWKPPRCEACKIFDHTNTHCPKKAKVVIPNPPNNTVDKRPNKDKDSIVTPVAEEDGFMEVQDKSNDKEKASPGVRETRMASSSDPGVPNAEFDFGNLKSDDDEVYEMDGSIAYGTSSLGGGFQLEDDFSDGYEAQVYDIPGQLDALCDQFDIHLKIRVDKVKIHRGIALDKVENSDPQSTPQVLPSFEEYTPPVTCPEEVEETLGTPVKVKPLDETQLEDLGLDTCNHDIPLSNREVPSFDESEPQPNPLLNCLSLDVSLGEERGPEPPIKPHSLDSFRMKEVDSLTINTPPSPHVASSHPKDTYCYYRPCIDDPKKHYGFKPESKEVSPLGKELSLFDRPNEVERGKMLEAHRLELILQQKNINVWLLLITMVIFDEEKLESS
ncbi:hypothetical protein Tco_0366108 [Tanacetum coccineum]